MCNVSLLDISKSVYYCKKSSPDIAEGKGLFWCKQCYESTEHEHKRVKVKNNDIAALMGVAGLDEAAKGNSAAYLDSLFEDYHNLETSNSKNRFKYETVPADDFGLTNEDILMLDDKQLNSLVSIKKYRPYRTMREDGKEDPSLAGKQVNVHAVIHKKKQFKQEIKDGLDTLK